MTKWKVIPIMLPVMAIVLAIPAYSQTNGGDGQPQSRTDLTPPRPTFVREAGVLDKLSWAGIALVNPKSAPAFLYGYEGLDDSTIGEVVSESQKGNIDIATVVMEHGRWLAITGEDADVQACAAEMKNCWIALPQPLREEYVGNAKEREFVARPNFWTSVGAVSR